MTPKDFSPLHEAAIQRQRVVAGMGDITRLRIDCIVCPSNSQGIMKGGVANTIRLEGGDEIEQEAVSLAPVAIGRAVSTAPGSLPCQHVLHAPTMKNPVEQSSRKTILRATKAALKRADRLNHYSIGFPGMGTGTGGVSYLTAARQMIDAISGFSKEANSLRLVVLVARSEPLASAWVSVLQEKEEFRSM